MTSLSTRAVCFPKLSLAALVLARFRLRSGLEVHFEDYPLYAKALLRWFRVPERWILATYSAVAQGSVQRLPRGDALPDQARLVLQAMQLADDLSVGIEPLITDSQWGAFGREFLGAEPAAAATIKRFSWDWAWPFAKTIVIARAIVSADRPLVAIWSPSIPENWRQACDSVIERSGVEIVSWPMGAAAIWRLFTGLAWAARVLGLTMATVIRHGIRRGGARQSALMGIELVDPRRMGGTPADLDYWIDGRKVKREDVLFYMHGAQRNFLKRMGVDCDEILPRLRGQGYRVLELYRLPLSFESIREILGALRKLPILSGGTGGFGSVVYEAWRAFLTYLPLFDHSTPLNMVHTPFPSGFAGPRLDSGVITGLCRSRGSRSVGYQNRFVYDTFEFDFDCYDLFLAWGAGWWDSWRPFLCRVRDVFEVGCSNLATLGASDLKDQRTVVVFAQELNGNHYSASYNYKLLRACGELARRYPRCKFVVKMKDLQDIDAILSDADFRRYCETISNFSFARLSRHECAGLLRQADIVIAAAYTTPGGDALLAGKPVIFYSELGGGCKALTSISGLVAETLSDLEVYFENALASIDRAGKWPLETLRRLDPYRDGAARDRIIERILQEA